MYDLYSGQLYAVCCRYAIDNNEAKDMLQEGFIKIFTNLNQYKATGTIYGWMKKVMVNNALNYIKKNKKHLAKNIEDYSEGQYTDSDITQNIDMKEIMNCFIELPYKYRVVLNMFIIDGYQYNEISTILNLDESTARSRVFRGKIMLQNIIKEKINFIVETKVFK